MKSASGKIVAVLIVLVTLAGCAATGTQETLFEYLDRTRTYNGAD